MKVKLSISIDNNVLSCVDELVKLGVFRNRSHAIDAAITSCRGDAKNG